MKNDIKNSRYMIRTSKNNVVVRVKTKYIKNITNILKMSAIQQHSTIDPADYVNIVGEVVALPLEIEDKREYKGFGVDDIKIGDTAIFSHSVIYEFEGMTM